MSTHKYLTSKPNVLFKSNDSIFTLKYLVQLRQHYTKPVFIKLIILGGGGVVVEAGVVVASVEVDAAVVERVVV